MEHLNPDYNCKHCGANKKDLEILAKYPETPNMKARLQVLCIVCSKVSIVAIEK